MRSFFRIILLSCGVLLSVAALILLLFTQPSTPESYENQYDRIVMWGEGLSSRDKQSIMLSYKPVSVNESEPVGRVPSEPAGAPSNDGVIIGKVIDNKTDSEIPAFEINGERFEQGYFQLNELNRNGAIPLYIKAEGYAPLYIREIISGSVLEPATALIRLSSDPRTVIIKDSKTQQPLDDANLVFSMTRDMLFARNDWEDYFKENPWQIRHKTSEDGMMTFPKPLRYPFYFVLKDGYRNQFGSTNKFFGNGGQEINEIYLEECRGEVYVKLPEELYSENMTVTGILSGWLNTISLEPGPSKYGFYETGLCSRIHGLSFSGMREIDRIDVAFSGIDGQLFFDLKNYLGTEQITLKLPKISEEKRYEVMFSSEGVKYRFYIKGGEPTKLQYLPPIEMQMVIGLYDLEKGSLEEPLYRNVVSLTREDYITFEDVE